MGRAIVTLVDRELVSVFDNHPGDHQRVFAHQAEEELATREEQVSGCEEKAGPVGGSDDIVLWIAGPGSRTLGGGGS